MQTKFVEQVERMEWTHVLRADRLNLRPSPEVEEIAVIAIDLHIPDVDPAILAAVERAIPRPLIFELRHRGRVRMAAAWKRPSQAEAGKWVTASHAFAPWEPIDSPTVSLSPALDMATLYAALLDPLLPPKISPDEPIVARVDRAAEMDQINREILRLQAGLQREKQFNRKVEMNAALRAANEKLNKLLGSGHGQA